MLIFNDIDFVNFIIFDQQVAFIHLKKVHFIVKFYLFASTECSIQKRKVSLYH